MRILVLGGSGFVGSWIVRELVARNHEVVVLSRSMRPSNGDAIEGVRFVVGDCADPKCLRECMQGCDAVFHTAGYYPVFSQDRNHQKERALYELRTVLAVASLVSVQRLIFTSSPAILIDDAGVRGKSTYHDIKCALHAEVVRWTEMGFPGIIVIPGACFGPGDWKPTTGRVVLEIASRRLRFIVEGKMNAVDVRDVAKAQVELLTRGDIGLCYQLGNLNCTFSEFDEIVGRISQTPVAHTRLPYKPLKVVAQMGEWIQYRLGSQTPYLPESGLDLIRYGAYLDSSAAKRDLGFRVRPIEETIQDTLNWFLANNYLAADGKVGDFNRFTLTKN
jgi:dihydroflavonol-4-reductase